MSVLLSNSQQLLSEHLALFMQLIYQWDIGSQILEAALEQIKDFLKDPSKIDEEESCVNVEMKRRKSEKKKRKTKKSIPAEEATQLRISLFQSLSLIQAVVNDSISQTSTYSPEVLTHIQSILAPTLSVLRVYIFPGDTVLSSRPQSTLQIFYGLLSLLLKIETHRGVSTSLAAAKRTVSESESEETQDNTLIGDVPMTLKELRVMLSNQILTMNPLGSIDECE